MRNEHLEISGKFNSLCPISPNSTQIVSHLSVQPARLEVLFHHKGQLKKNMYFNLNVQNHHVFAIYCAPTASAQM